MTSLNEFNMRKPSRLSRFLILALFCTGTHIAHAASPAANKPYPIMTTEGGEKHANTCSPREKKILRAEVVKTQMPDPEQAWKLVDTLLCAEKTPATRKLIRNAMAKKIKATYEGTGQEPVFETIKPSDDTAERLMAGGSAWQAGFDAAQSEGWRLYYYSDEVSITGYTIDYQKAKWVITEYGSASD